MTLYEENNVQMNNIKPNAALNLFVWCILFNRVEIAKIIIQHGDVKFNLYI